MNDLVDQGKPKWNFRIKIWVPVALVIILCLGWSLTKYLGDHASDELRLRGDINISEMSNQLGGELTAAENAARAMTGSPWIAPALITGSGPDIERANAVLDRYNTAFGASVCYLMDIAGTTIASSNRNSPDSFVGKYYGFRPYYLKAISGYAGRYFALGVTSGERGFYASAPVRGQRGEIIGVVVLKKTIYKVEDDFARYHYAFFIDPHGIIFLSGNKDMLLHSLWPLDEEVQRTLLESRQFGADPFQAVLASEPANGAGVALNGKSYIVNRQQVDREGWSIVLLSSTNTVTEFRLLGIAITFCLYALFFGFLIAAERLRKMDISERKRAAEELQRLSHMDGLTGIPNRRFFDEFLDREWRRAARDATPLSLLMCDIDYFKLYNDTHGHQCGDDCLRQVAGALSRNLKRPSDLVFRYGGEEFAVILPDTNACGAKTVAENLREGVESLGIEHINSPVSTYVTISVGVATVTPLPGSSAKVLVSASDRALYWAKRAGRNRVEINECEKLSDEQELSLGPNDFDNI
ncbi:MAG: diguanylate cyclase [Eubacteriales bacterium]